MRLAIVLALVSSLAACGGARARTSEPASRPATDAPRTRAPNGQWTAEDIATFERLATGRAGTFVDIDHLTPEQLRTIGVAIDALLARAEPDGHEERRTLLLWVLGTTQVHVAMSARIAFMIPDHTDHSYSIENVLALAAGVIASPDGIEQQLHGLEGVLVYYRAARAAGAQEQPLLESLLADQASGHLRDRAAELAHGIEPGRVEP